MNKKLGIIILCLSVLLIVAGVVVGLTEGWSFNPGSYSVDPVASLESADVTSVKLVVGSADVSIYNSWDGNFEVNVSSGMEKYVDVQTAGGQLQITQRERTGFSLFKRQRYDRIELHIPAGALESLAAESGSGDVTLSGVDSPDMTVSLTTGSGTISVYDTNADSVSIAAGSGDIYMDECWVMRDLNVTTGSGYVFLQAGMADNVSVAASSGRVALYDMIASRAITAATSSGDVDVDSAGAETVHVKTTSGDVSLTNSVFGASEIQCSSGSVQLLLTGIPEDYTLTFKTGSGDRTGAETGSGDVLIAVTTTSGDLDVEFEDR